MVVIAPTVKLNNGKEIPVLGLGTYALQGSDGKEVIKAAIDTGYRHFDSALLYHSEGVVGEAVREKIVEGVIKREDVFITTKLWCSYAHPGHVLKACQRSLKNLGLDYVDLYLVHWPFGFKPVDNPDEPVQKSHSDAMSLFAIEEYFPRDASGNLILTDQDYVDTWKEMEQVYKNGWAKSIGVSNFNSKQLERLLEHAAVKPVINQVETHPYLNQKKLIAFCKERDIYITAYGPLGAAGNLLTPMGKNLPRVLDHLTILDIAKARGKTSAQIILRYLVQLGTIVIPKTGSMKRLPENMGIFDFELSPSEMSEMDALDCNYRIYVMPQTENHKYFPFKEEF